jgi:hypothetical protein
MILMGVPPELGTGHVLAPLSTTAFLSFHEKIMQELYPYGQHNSSQFLLIYSFFNIFTQGISI